MADNIATPFGDLSAGQTEGFLSVGGMQSANGRELLLTYIIEKWCLSELVSRTPTDEFVVRFTRILGRAIAQFAVSLKHNGFKLDQELIAEDLVDFVEERAKEELVTTLKRSTIIHLNHGKQQ